LSSLLLDDCESCVVQELTPSTVVIDAKPLDCDCEVLVSTVEFEPEDSDHELPLGVDEELL
jgi:hypothetical protein